MPAFIISVGHDLKCISFKIIMEMNYDRSYLLVSSLQAFYLFSFYQTKMHEYECALKKKEKKMNPQNN